MGGGGSATRRLRCPLPGRSERARRGSRGGRHRASPSTDAAPPTSGGRRRGRDGRYDGRRRAPPPHTNPRGTRRRRGELVGAFGVNSVRRGRCPTAANSLLGSDPRGRPYSTRRGREVWGGDAYVGILDVLRDDRGIPPPPLAPCRPRASVAALGSPSMPNGEWNCCSTSRSSRPWGGRGEGG